MFLAKQKTNRVKVQDASGLSLFLTTFFYGQSAHNIVSVGHRFRTRGLFVRIEGSGVRVRIGNNVTWSGRINVFGDNVHVTIGDRCDAKKVAVTAWEGSVSIGSDCLLAKGADIRSSDIHRIFDRDSGELLNPARDVSIGNRVWIGHDATIAKGSRIADGCVVGMRALVTGEFDQPGSVLAGVPARVVRDNVVWRR
ncbi:MAG: hypothetical protein JWQ36_2859 [Enterovirga sp.]|nr:hypothetical protein [Enterovirga sp.]